MLHAPGKYINIFFTIRIFLQAMPLRYKPNGNHSIFICINVCTMYKINIKIKLTNDSIIIINIMNKNDMKITLKSSYTYYI
jgi:hypothetical protein